MKQAMHHIPGALWAILKLDKRWVQRMPTHTGAMVLCTLVWLCGIVLMSLLEPHITRLDYDLSFGQNLLRGAGLALLSVALLFAFARFRRGPFALIFSAFVYFGLLADALLLAMEGLGRMLADATGGSFELIEQGLTLPVAVWVLVVCAFILRRGLGTGPGRAVLMVILWAALTMAADIAMQTNWLGQS